MSGITGNKGEWSELYVLLKLLSEGKLYAANENLEKLENVYFPILKIIRSEDNDTLLEYIINSEKTVKLCINGKEVKVLERSVLNDYANKIYERITQGSNHAFEIRESEAIMEELCCKKIKAPSSDKTDITMQLLDINTGYNPICGFSIKSELGSAPTLLNASGTTNFQFELSGIDDNGVSIINEIDGKQKILDRVKYIESHGSFKYIKTQNECFSTNLMYIDSYMEDIMAQSLLYSYKTGINNCRKITEWLESENPLGYPRNGLYKYKFKKFLCAIALGMTPGKEWNGTDEANGGYIVVTTSGDVLTYHIYNRDCFEEYLLNNTKFERASTTRHHFATAYKEDDRCFFDLNLQIRFI